MSVLKIKDQNGNWIDILTIKGDTGEDYILTEQDKQEIARLVDTPVDDVQVNGTSVVSGGVAEIPIASNNGEMGLAKVNSSLGTGIGIDQDGLLAINPAGTNGIKVGIGYTPIVPSRQHQSAFYGLAKAAGDTTQSQSDNPVGTYTEDAKTAIRTMLGLQEVYDDYSSALTALGVI